MPRGDNFRIREDDPRVRRLFAAMLKAGDLGEAAKASGMSPKAAARILREEGIEVRPVPKRRRPPSGTTHRVESSLAHGGTAKAAAEAAGVDPSTVSKLMKRSGMSVRELKEARWLRVEGIVARLVARGRTEKDACRRCRVSYAAFMKRKSRRLAAEDRSTDA